MRNTTLARRAAALVLLVSLALGARLPQPPPAYAATFAVTTITDAPHALPIDGTCTSTLPGGTCTLRAAIQAANFLTGGPYSIDLQVAGTYLLTVTGANEDLGAAGDLDLNNVTVTINNASGGTIVLDGNQTDRVFDVGPNTAAQLTLSNVTIQHGNVTGEGGGIQVNRGSLTGSNLIFRNNASTGQGGGLRVGAPDPPQPSAVLTHVTFDTNTAHAGGGLSSSGQITVDDGTFTNNTTSISGGGAAMNGGSLSNVVFTNNTSANGGGYSGPQKLDRVVS